MLPVIATKTATAGGGTRELSSPRAGIRVVVVYIRQTATLSSNRDSKHYDFVRLVKLWKLRWPCRWENNNFAWCCFADELCQLKQLSEPNYSLWNENITVGRYDVILLKYKRGWSPKINQSVNQFICQLITFTE